MYMWSMTYTTNVFDIVFCCKPTVSCVYIHTTSCTTNQMDIIMYVTVNIVLQVEQDMAVGTDAQGDPVTDPLRDMMPCLFDRNIQ